MSIHVHRVPTRETAVFDDGVRFCFVCRKPRQFALSVHTPTDSMSYYGPHAAIECDRGHENGDLFPGRHREWDET